jgi:hypothetical protein
MLVGKKPWGKIFVRAYVYIPFYFIVQILEVWYYHRMGFTSTTAFSAHFAGFAFGVLFALGMKASKFEETYIHPKIEAKVSFAAAPTITQALEILDRGDALSAERMLKSQMIKSPNDLDVIMALIQVYQTTSNFEQLNAMYGRLIHHHLSKQDKEAALIAYDNLLSCFPDNEVNPRIAVRDWTVLCEYLRDLNMNREAGVEIERMAKAFPDDASIMRACIIGGEAAFLSNDVNRSLWLFEKAKSFNPPVGLMNRIDAGLEKCRKRLDNMPKWAKEPPKTGQRKIPV